MTFSGYALKNEIHEFRFLAQNELLIQLWRQLSQTRNPDSANLSAVPVVVKRGGLKTAGKGYILPVSHLGSASFNGGPPAVLEHLFIARQLHPDERNAVCFLVGFIGFLVGLFS